MEVQFGNLNMSTGTGMISPSVHPNYSFLTLKGNGSITEQFFNSTTPPISTQSQEIRDLNVAISHVRLIVTRILLRILVVFGVVGNMVNIAVLTRRWMKSSTNYYLTALAVSDALYLLMALTLSLNHEDYIKSNPYYLVYYFIIGRRFSNLFSNISVWMTVTFTVERYIGVCHPMKGRVLCTPQRATYIIGVVFCAVTVLTLPEFFDMHVVYKNVSNVMIPVATTSHFGQQTSYSVGYTNFNHTMFTFLPLIMLAIFNTLLVRAVWRASKQRRSMTKVVVVQNDRTERHHQEQHKITLMLISVVLVFLLCQAPQAVANLCFTFYSAYGVSAILRLKFIITGNLVNLLVVINCSCNFILYSVFSAKFRKTFEKLFCRCMPRGLRHDYVFSDVMSQHSHRATLTDARTRTTRLTASPVATPRNSLVSGPTSVSQGSPPKFKNGYLAVPTDNKRRGVNVFISKV